MADGQVFQVYCSAGDLHHAVIMRTGCSAARGWVAGRGLDDGIGLAIAADRQAVGDDG